MKNYKSVKQSKFYVEQTQNRHQTEYDRLGIEPNKGGVSKLHDENGFPIKHIPARQAPRSVRQITNDPVRINAPRSQEVSFGAGPAHVPPTSKQHSPQPPEQVHPNERVVPPQPMAHVGMVDQMWSDNVLISTGEKVSPAVVVDNNEFVDVESLQGHNPLEAQEKFAESTEREPNWHVQASQNQEQSFDVKDLKEGNYAVCFDGEVLISTDSLAEVKSTVEDLLLRPNVNMDNLTVFKRLSLDFGVLLG